MQEIIAIYAITDDLLTAMPAAGYAYGHKDDIRCEMSDAEIITIVFFIIIILVLMCA